MPETVNEGAGASNTCSDAALLGVRVIGGKVRGGGHRSGDGVGCPVTLADISVFSLADGLERTENLSASALYSTRSWQETKIISAFSCASEGHTGNRQADEAWRPLVPL